MSEERLTIADLTNLIANEGFVVEKVRREKSIVEIAPMDNARRWEVTGEEIWTVRIRRLKEWD